MTMLLNDISRILILSIRHWNVEKNMKIFVEVETKKRLKILSDFVLLSFILNLTALQLYWTVKVIDFYCNSSISWTMHNKKTQLTQHTIRVYVSLSISTFLLNAEAETFRWMCQFILLLATHHHHRHYYYHNIIFPLSDEEIPIW